MFSLNHPTGPSQQPSRVGVVYEVGKSLAASQFKERLRNVSLTKLRLQQMLHLDDRHIPLPIIRLYYEELQREPRQQNKESLMTYTMLLRDWHITKNKLNFIRDVTKLAVIFGKRFTDNLSVVEASLNNVLVTPQDVYESIMSNLYDEADKRNVSLSEYLLQKYDEIYSHDSTTWGVDSLQAFFPESRIRRRNLWNSFTVSFLLRLSKETLRTITKLDGRSDFFTDSQPTWSRREGTPYARTAREIAEEDEIRRKLMEKLLCGDVSTRTQEQLPKITELSPVIEQETKEPSYEEGLSSEKKARISLTTQDEDETHTIDTSTFRTCYEEAIRGSTLIDDSKRSEEKCNAKPPTDDEKTNGKIQVHSISTPSIPLVRSALTETPTQQPFVQLLDAGKEQSEETSSMVEQLERNELDIEKALIDMGNTITATTNEDIGKNVAPRDDMLENDDDDDDNNDDDDEEEIDDEEDDQSSNDDDENDALVL